MKQAVLATLVALGLTSLGCGGGPSRDINGNWKATGWKTRRQRLNTPKAAFHNRLETEAL
jgi:hypothetical protein